MAAENYVPYSGVFSDDDASITATVEWFRDTSELVFLWVYPDGTGISQDYATAAEAANVSVSGNEITVEKLTNDSGEYSQSVWIYRKALPTVETVATTSGSVPVASIIQELEEHYRRLDDAAVETAKAIKIPEADTDTHLPPKEIRAGHIVGFDDEGKPAVGRNIKEVDEVFKVKEEAEASAEEAKAAAETAAEDAVKEAEERLSGYVSDAGKEAETAKEMATIANANATSAKEYSESAKSSADAAAESAESALKSAQSAEESYENTVAERESIKKDIDAETERATAAETSLSESLSAEVERAKSAETANASAIETETTRATNAEEANAKAITKKGGYLGAAYSANNATVVLYDEYKTPTSDMVALSSVSLRAASASNAGIMTSTMYSSLTNATANITTNTANIESLQTQAEETAGDVGDLSSRVSTIESSLTSAMHYKGSVATVSDLPTENVETGDFYNVSEDGTNYAWDGESWDEVSGMAAVSLATTTTAGLVKLGTGVALTLSTGGVVGLTSSGQMLARAAEDSAYGTVKLNEVVKATKWTDGTNTFFGFNEGSRVLNMQNSSIHGISSLSWDGGQVITFPTSSGTFALTSDVDAVSDDVITEYNRAKSAESGLSALIETETTRAKAAENTLQESIDAIDTTISEKANDADVVKLTGAQTIYGKKTFGNDTTFDGVVVINEDTSDTELTVHGDISADGSILSGSIIRGNVLSAEDYLFCETASCSNITSSGTIKFNKTDGTTTTLQDLEGRVSDLEEAGSGDGTTSVKKTKIACARVFDTDTFYFFDYDEDTGTEGDTSIVGSADLLFFGKTLPFSTIGLSFEKITSANGMFAGNTSITEVHLPYASRTDTITDASYMFAHASVPTFTWITDRSGGTTLKKLTTADGMFLGATNVENAYAWITSNESQFTALVSAKRMFYLSDAKYVSVDFDSFNMLEDASYMFCGCPVAFLCASSSSSNAYGSFLDTAFGCLKNAKGMFAKSAYSGSSGLIKKLGLAENTVSFSCLEDGTDMFKGCSNFMGAQEIEILVNNLPDRTDLDAATITLPPQTSIIWDDCGIDLDGTSAGGEFQSYGGIGATAGTQLNWDTVSAALSAKNWNAERG